MVARPGLRKPSGNSRAGLPQRWVLLCHAREVSAADLEAIQAIEGLKIVARANGSLLVEFDGDLHRALQPLPAWSADKEHFYQRC